MNKCFVTYTQEENGKVYWTCQRFSANTKAKIPESLDKCYYANCRGRLPRRKVCDWKDCTKPIAPNKLRHCSELCRKRDNRYAYKLRQKALKEANSEN